MTIKYTTLMTRRGLISGVTATKRVRAYKSRSHAYPLHLF